MALKIQRSEWYKLEGEASSADESAIINALPLLRECCFNYSLDK